jgi:hypothetical protein
MNIFINTLLVPFSSTYFMETKVHNNNNNYNNNKVNFTLEQTTKAQRGVDA